MYHATVQPGRAVTEYPHGSVTATAELLEDRRLMSRAVLDTFTVPASGATVTSNLKLHSGVDYLVEASGTLDIRVANGREADAEYGQVLPDYTWQDSGKDGFDWGIGLGDGAAGAISHVGWGAFDASHVYSTTHTGAAKKLSAKFFDDQYNDNGGSITITIYGPEQFNADLKVSDNANPANATTVTTGTAGSLTIAENLSGQATIKIGPSDSLPTDYAMAGGTWNASAKAFFVWSAVPVGAGTVGTSSGDLKGGNPTVLLTDGGGSGGGDFTLNSGFDADGDGVLDIGEIQRTINVHLV